MRGVVLLTTAGQDVFWLDGLFQMFHSQLGLIENVQVFGPLNVTNLGGTFTSPPVPVASGSNRLDVFGLGTDFNVYHKIFQVTAGVGAWSPAWENLGGSFTSTPAAIANPDGTIDLFGLGADRALLHRQLNGGVWSDWDKLGGGFTSLPVVLRSANGSFDIFARGLDFLVYYANWNRTTPPDWEVLGGGLLGEPVAASAPAAVRVLNAMFVFVAGFDGSIWYTSSDDSVWSHWASLGPAKRPASLPDVVNLAGAGSPVTFFSEPVATAFFPASGSIRTGGGGSVGGTASGTTGGVSPVGRTAVSTTAAPATVAPPVPGAQPPSNSQPAATLPEGSRVDVFAVGTDTALYHMFLDSQGWHGEADAAGKATGNWEAITSISSPSGAITTSSCACAPSIVASTASASAVLAPAPAFKILEPNPDGTIHFLFFGPTSPQIAAPRWTSGDFGPAFALPSYYTFSVDRVLINSLRSSSVSTDSDLAAATLAVGKWPVLPASYNMGDCSAGAQGLFNLTFGPLVVELPEPVILTYSIVNSGHSSPGAITNLLIKAGSDFATSQLTSLVNEKQQTVTVDLGLSDDIPDVPVVVAAAVTSALAGPLTAALQAGIQELVGLAFSNCDGLVASQPLVYQKGRDVQNLIASKGTNGKFAHSTTHLGNDSPKGCGGNSNYVVFWSFTQAKLPFHRG